MTAETILSNARIVLADRILAGHVVVRDGRVAVVGEGAARGGEDLGGDTLIPGLVELHTDHIEGHVAPRPKVRWNAIAAIQAHDAQIASSGITTVFDALRVGADEDAGTQVAATRAMADEIARAKSEDRLRADHFVHVRCEISSADAVDGFAAMADSSLIRLASLMDHAPGQRQFVDLDTYRVYYQGKNKMSDAEFERFAARRIAESEKYSAASRRDIAAIAHEHGIALASHDDATLQHVEEAISFGIALAEFPTTMVAAKASHEAGLKVLMGAPNVVRGGSHSGNVSALDLAREGVLDILSSDYVPFSLVQAAFQMADRGDAELPDAIRLVSKNPAEAVGLYDRGEIVAGRRADLVRVREVPGAPPVVRAVYREGRRVA